MKKSTKTAGNKKLLLSAQKVRELTPETLGNVVGGMGCFCYTTECGSGSCHTHSIVSNGD